MKLFIWKGNAKQWFCFSALCYSDGSNTSCAMQSVIIKPILWAQRNSIRKPRGKDSPPGRIWRFCKFQTVSPVNYSNPPQGRRWSQTSSASCPHRVCMAPGEFRFCVILRVSPPWAGSAFNLVDTWWIQRSVSPAQNKWSRMDGNIPWCHRLVYLQDPNCLVGSFPKQQNWIFERKDLLDTYK